MFKPTFRQPLFWLSCKKAGPYKRSKLILVEALWALCSVFDYRLYYVEMDGSIVHISYVIDKAYKFPFLKKKDYQIGPCYTGENARGKGIYPSTISYILQNESGCSHEGNPYLIIRDANTPSIKGAAAAGFYKCADLDKTKLLKRYIIRKEK